MLKNGLLMIVVLVVMSGCGVVEKQVQAPSEKVSSANGEVQQDILSSNVAITQDKDKVLFDLSLANQTDKDISVTYPTAQKFDIVVTEKETNQEVYRFSKGQSFAQSIVNETIKAGETASYKAAWEQAKPGSYVATIEWKYTGNTPSLKQDFTVNAGEEAFKNVQITGKDGTYKVTGEARVFEGNFFYAVEEGHEYLIEETNVKVEKGAPNWSPFELSINIAKDQLPQNGALTLELYEQSAKDGSITNLSLVKLEQFQN